VHNLNNAQKLKDPMSKVLKLKIFSKTRFNDVYYMIERYIDLHCFIIDVFPEAKTMIKDEEINLLKLY
jgi:hypothetical protein